MSENQRDVQALRDEARERAFDALLEQQLGDQPPVAAILARARMQAAREASPRSRRRSLLLVAVALLGIGVVVIAAWQARERRAADEAGRQGPTESVELHWPTDAASAYRPADLDGLPQDLTHLRLSAPLHEIGDLSRFAKLQHLVVRLTPAKIARPILSGEAARVRDRLGGLASTPELRRLALEGVALEPADLRALRHLRHLQVLELNLLLPTVADDAFRQAVEAGGVVVGRTFDREMAEVVAKHSRAGSLRLSGMATTADGLRALAPARLRSLVIAMSTGTGPEALLALAELDTLEHLELRFVHGAGIPAEKLGRLGSMGSRALSVGFMQAIARLPQLRSLVFEACVLDHELLAALPTGLLDLDLRGCLGVDGRLAEVVAGMPDLRALGLPLAMQDGREFSSMLRPPLDGDAVRTMRLSGAEAATIVAARVWTELRLEGTLTAGVTEALAGQMGLRELVLTPTNGSAELTFLPYLPKLERLRFVATDFASESVLAPLPACASLSVVEFVDCTVNRVMKRFDVDLRDDQVARYYRSHAW